MRPLRLLDCCQESDGAVAVVVTTLERARDLRQPPAVIRAAAQGASRDQQMMTSYYRDAIGDLPEMADVARELYAQSGLGPKDFQTAVIYDHFTPFVLAQLEAFGFCGRGEAKDFVRDGTHRDRRRAADQHPRRPARRGLHPRHERRRRGRAAGARHAR